MIIAVALAAFLSGAPAAPPQAPPIVSITRPPPPAPAPEPVDAAALAAARELLVSMDFNGQMDRTAHQVLESSFKTVMDTEERAAGTTLPDDLKQTVYALILRSNERVLADMKATALDESARVYAKYFTADELRALQRLQSNPVLVKAQHLAPQLVSELMQIGMRSAAAHMPELQSQIVAAVKDWIAKHGQPSPHHS